MIPQLIAECFVPVTIRRWNILSEQQIVRTRRVIRHLLVCFSFIQNPTTESWKRRLRMAWQALREF
jgi:hypothetical protein